MPSIIGTAMHTWMEDALRRANEQLGRVRWIPETKVEIRPGLAGTADVLDLDTMTVLDWKFPGKTGYDKYMKYGPSNTYRGQAHLYGAGYVNLGFPIEYVGIVFISRVGSLRQMHLWREPYSPELVAETLDRIDATESMMTALNVESDPGLFNLIPIAPDDDCGATCPWWSANPGRAYSCGGKEEIK